jgi:hypothetical protein
LALLGCGSSGDDDADSTTTSAAEATTTTDASTAFSSLLNDLCTEGDAASTAAGDDFEAALADLQAADQAQDRAAYTVALDDAETATEAIISSIEDFGDAVDALDVPTDLQTPLNTYLDALGVQLALADQLRAALVADDGAAFSETIDQIEQADASNRQARADAAEELGAPECAPDEDESTDESTDSTDSTGTTVAGETTDTTSAK